MVHRRPGSGNILVRRVMVLYADFKSNGYQILKSFKNKSFVTAVQKNSAISIFHIVNVSPLSIRPGKGLGQLLQRSQNRSIITITKLLKDRRSYF